MKKIKILKIISTLFLIGIVVTKTITLNESFTEFEILKLDFKLLLNFESNTFYLSSLLIGYILSLLGTILSMKIVGKKFILLFSVLISILGILSYLNEFTRIWFNHLQILISFPILLVILDWIGYSILKNKQ